MNARRRAALLVAAWLTGVGVASASDPAVLNLQQALDVATADTSRSALDRSSSRLAVMRNYYDALIADREYAAANEQVAMAYVTFNRARVKAGAQWQGQIAEKELELKYAGALDRRLSAGHRQRLARHALADAMGSSTVPGDLDDPAMPGLAVPLPEQSTLEALMFDRNLAWRAAAGSARSERDRLRQELRSTLLGTVLEIERLVRTALPRVDREDELAQLRVERARDELEQGGASELGLAMAGTAEVAFHRMKLQAEFALALARLEHLLDTPIGRLPAK